MMFVSKRAAQAALAFLPAAICLALEPDPQADKATEPFETVVVTASPGRTTEFRSSISVNSISVEQVAEYAPRGTAEIFRNIPGLRSEAAKSWWTTSTWVRFNLARRW